MISYFYVLLLELELALVLEEYKMVLVIVMPYFVHNILFTLTFKDLKLLHKAITIIIIKEVTLLDMERLCLHKKAKQNTMTMFIVIMAIKNFICKNP